VKLRASWADDFAHFNSPRQQSICYQRAVAAPGNGFGAHDRGLLRFREVNQIVPRFAEIGCLHVIGEAAEAGLRHPVLSESGRARRKPPSPGMYR
jgi:hypothetical protein